MGPILKTLIKSAPFDAYIGMLILSLIHVSLPAPAVSIAQLIGNANAFMAMLMLGVGFKLSGDKSRSERSERSFPYVMVWQWWHH